MGFLLAVWCELHSYLKGLSGKRSINTHRLNLLHSYHGQLILLPIYVKFCKYENLPVKLLLNVVV